MFNVCEKIKEDGEIMLVLTNKFHSLTLILYSSRAGRRVGFSAMCTLINKEVSFLSPVSYCGPDRGYQKI
jgi:hypothetical protein